MSSSVWSLGCVLTSRTIQPVRPGKSENLNSVISSLPEKQWLSVELLHFLISSEAFGIHYGMMKRNKTDRNECQGLRATFVRVEGDFLFTKHKLRGKQQLIPILCGQVRNTFLFQYTGLGIFKYGTVEMEYMNFITAQIAVMSGISIMSRLEVWSQESTVLSVMLKWLS